MSVPALPTTHLHPLWHAWDLAVDVCLSQLERFEKHGTPFTPSTFFEDQLSSFEVWLEFANQHKPPPMQLPVLLQVLLSSEHRARTLMLLARFLDKGAWAVNLCLSVGIFPYMLKLLQSPSKDLKDVLIFIWCKIVSYDDTCQNELSKIEYCSYFVSHLLKSSQSSSNGAPMGSLTNSSIHSAESGGSTSNNNTATPSPVMLPQSMGNEASHQNVAHIHEMKMDGQERKNNDFAVSVQLASNDTRNGYSTTSHTNSQTHAHPPSTILQQLNPSASVAVDSTTQQLPTMPPIITLPATVSHNHLLLPTTLPPVQPNQSAVSPSMRPLKLAVDVTATAFSPTSPLLSPHRPQSSTSNSSYSPSFTSTRPFNSRSNKYGDSPLTQQAATHLHQPALQQLLSCYILSVICRNNARGQQAILNSGLQLPVNFLYPYLTSSYYQLRMWSLLFLSQYWLGFSQLKTEAVAGGILPIINNAFHDKEPEVML